jgi:hypothetical protein
MRQGPLSAVDTGRAPPPQTRTDGWGTRGRYFPAVLSIYGRRWLIAAAALLAAAGVGIGVYIAIDSLGGGKAAQPPAPGPKIVLKKPQPEAAQDLGFPAFATKNTTRVAGADPVADAAGVALAVYPSTGGVKGPAAVSLVEAGDWPSGIAAASLVGPPVGAPVLLTASDSVPVLTADALRALAPSGSSATDDKQIFAIGSAAAPGGPRTSNVSGSNPAEIADAVDRLRQRLTHSEPDHIVLASSDRAPFAMPAAAWAARSGDPVLFVQKESVPQPTLDALKRHDGVPVYVLGPASVISDKAFKQVQKVAPGAKRVGADNAIDNAIEFARYADSSFGWDINDPGHGFVIANEARPSDAAAAAPLSASGDWGPLLLTNDAATVPAALHGYLLDVKPGYVSDPTRALYNHVWLMGNETAISVAFQAQVDELAELVPVTSATAAGRVGPPPGTADQASGKTGGTKP